jgi:hypothetical protein
MTGDGDGGRRRDRPVFSGGAVRSSPSVLPSSSCAAPPRPKRRSTGGAGHLIRGAAVMRWSGGTAAGPAGSPRQIADQARGSDSARCILRHLQDEMRYARRRRTPAGDRRPQGGPRSCLPERPCQRSATFLCRGSVAAVPPGAWAWSPDAPVRSADDLLCRVDNRPSAWVRSQTYGCSSHRDAVSRAFRGDRARGEPTGSV